jgi:hypothetical protein
MVLPAYYKERTASYKHEEGKGISTTCTRYSVVDTDAMSKYINTARQKPEES